MKSVEGGLYFHFGITESLSRSKQLSDYLSLQANDCHTVSLQVNIDGLPLFNSSCKQFWPIFGRVCKPVETDPFVIGLYCGDHKPDVGEYLQDFVEVLLLQQGPTHIKGINRPVQVKLSCFICDTFARAFVKQVKGHSGYYGYVTNAHKKDLGRAR